MRKIQRDELQILHDGLEAAQRICLHALPKFNWRDSALDAEAIQALNEGPAKINYAYAVTLAILAEDSPKRTPPRPEGAATK